MDLTRVETLAMRHHGLVPLSAMRRPGETDRKRASMPSTSAWHRAVRSGELELVHPGVARMRGAPRTRDQRIAAAVLALPGAVASHRSAAWLWGVERPDTDPVDLIAPVRDCRVRLEDVLVHRPRDRADLAPSTRRGIDCTNPLRMLCDLGAVDPHGVADAVRHVLVAGLARPSALRELVVRHGVQGRTGIAALRDAVHAWPLGDKPADSILEPAFSALVRDHGLPPVAFHQIVEGYEVDFLVIGTPVVVECDGWEFHVKDRERARRDRGRDSALLAAGHPTVRFTWEHITRRAAWSAERLRRVLRRWAPQVLGEHERVNA